jgi:hypothetical protein
MNWKEASRWVEYMYRNVTSSIPITLYGYSIWCLPYLLSQGITFEQFVEFNRNAREMLLASLDDVDIDFSEPLERLAAIFRPAAPLTVSASA